MTICVALISSDIRSGREIYESFSRSTKSLSNYFEPSVRAENENLYVEQQAVDS